jgi:hypothetical protein
VAWAEEVIDAEKSRYSREVFTEDRLVLSALGCVAVSPSMCSLASGGRSAEPLSAQTSCLA